MQTASTPSKPDTRATFDPCPKCGGTAHLKISNGDVRNGRVVEVRLFECDDCGRLIPQSVAQPQRKSAAGG